MIGKITEIVTRKYMWLTGIMKRTSTSVLRLLRGKNEPVSGAFLSDELSVSRNAVWKAVVALREEGFDIEGIRNQGYRLMRESEKLSVPGIESHLSDQWQDLLIEVHDELSSTNTLTKERVSDSKHRFLVAANHQTAGRGRRGRAFYSPEGVGLYFSLGIPWVYELSPTSVTTLTAVAVSRVLQRMFDVDVKIKWVNDLFLENKKICGILTEATSDLETGAVSAVVIGIGINLKAPKEGYPEAIASIAGAVSNCEASFDRNLLTGNIVNEIGALLDFFSDHSYMEEYRARSFLLGRPVMLDSGETIVPIDVSDEGALIYREGDELIHLSSGEVRVVGF